MSNLNTETTTNKQPVLFTCLVCNFETISPNFDLSNYPKVKVTCPKCSSDKFKMTHPTHHCTRCSENFHHKPICPTCQMSDETFAIGSDGKATETIKGLAKAILEAEETFGEYDECLRMNDPQELTRLEELVGIFITKHNVSDEEWEDLVKWAKLVTK